MQKTIKDVLKYNFWEKLKTLPYIEQIIIYGSRARNDGAERADIDIAIVCPAATITEWSFILEIIENADTLLKIDCVRYDALPSNSPLKQSIDREGYEVFRRSYE